ncbi:hypothetical protein J6590_060409 [Homalodisca vitripennis]|nr:hypothetical protein J6590_060409 [Homalodisca vitripennis]
MSLFGFESLNLRKDVMEQMFLRGLVQGRVDSAEGLGVISFRVPSFNSRGRLLFELPHVRTVAHASSPLLRMIPTTSSSVVPALEELKKHGANPKNKGVSPRSSGSLFGLGIGANLLGVHAGAGIGHGRGGYGDMGQGFVGKPAGGQYPQYPYPPYMQPQPYYLSAAHAPY